MLIEAIHRGDPTVLWYSHDFVCNLLCNPSNELCWNNDLVNYQDGKLFKFKLKFLENELAWFQWQKCVNIRKRATSKAGNLGIKEGGHGRVEATNSIISLAPSVFRTQSNMYNGSFLRK